MSSEQSKYRAGRSWRKAFLSARGKLAYGRIAALLLLVGGATAGVVLTVAPGQGSVGGPGSVLVDPVVNAQVDVPAPGSSSGARHPEPSATPSVPDSATRVRSGKAGAVPARASAPGAAPAPGASANPSAVPGAQSGTGAPSEFAYAPSGATSPSAVPSSSAPAPVAPATSASPTPTIQPSTGCGTLTGGEELASGQALLSCNSDYKLAMQSDGNLVLYQGATALWNSATNGTTATSSQMLADGNLVLYSSSGSQVWDSGTAGNDGAWLAVQNDGNLVIYSATGTVLWYTGTS